MFFNYDSFEIAVIAFVISGIFISGMFIYSGKSSTNVNNDSLVNTSPNLDLSSLDLSNNLTSLAESKLIDTGVQTDILLETANTHVNTGMQTSGRMWLETVTNWINEILASPITTNPNPHTPQYVDVGVQTNATSTWATVKQWFLEVCSIRSSELSSMGYSKVDKWRNNIDSNQSIDLHDSESPLITVGTYNEEYETSLEELVNPNDSASNISEVISNNVSESKIVYDITDPTVLENLLNDPSVYSYYDHTDHIHYVISDVVLSVDPSIMNLFI